MSAQRRSAAKRDVTGTAASRRSAAGVPRSAQPAAAGAAERSARQTPERAKSSSTAREAQVRGRFGERTEGVRKLYRDTVTEIRRINWPDQETTRNLTIVVIGISVVLGILLGGIDFMLLRLLELF